MFNCDEKGWKYDLIQVYSLDKAIMLKENDPMTVKSDSQIKQKFLYL